MNRRNFIKLSAAALTMPLVGLPELAEVEPVQASYTGAAFYKMGQDICLGTVKGFWSLDGARSGLTMSELLEDYKASQYRGVAKR